MKRREVPHGLVVWGRLGYLARGILYLIVGGLAVLAGLGRGGETTDSKGALVTLFDQPLGTALLWAVAVGLAGYAVWRAADALLDPEGRGHDVKGVAVRAVHLGSAAAHAALAVFAVRLALGDASPTEGGDAHQQATGSVFALPGGRWLVLATGVVVVVVGVVHVVRGLIGHYERRLERRPATWVRVVGRLGHGARGVVITTIGAFLVTAAARFHSREARGLEGALDALREQPFGAWLFLAVAVGLVAFGVWSFVEARLRFMPAEPAAGPRAREGALAR